MAETEIKNWGTAKYGESPLQQYFRQVDMQLIEATQGDYYKRALQEDIATLTRLFMEDMKFRSDHFLNVVLSISGAQGSGKSLSGVYLLLLLAKIFQKPIDINNILFDPEELDKKIETAVNRESFMLDEQRVTNVGMMSKTIQDRLVDFEEQLRKSQINLIYCAPSLRQHEHYFVLETYKIIRIQNPKCAECKEKKCKTCNIPQHERSGYPKYFLLMLKTKREPDHTLVCRGLLKIPMPNPKIVKEYDEIKDTHIERLKRKDSNMWEQMKKLRDTIWEQKKEELITQLKDRRWKEQTKKQIQICIYDVKGQRHLTNEAVDLMITMLQGKAKEFITKYGLDDEEDKYDEEEVIKLLKEDSNETKT